MSNLRTLSIGTGVMALMALAGTAAAQLGADSLPPTQAQLRPSEAPRPQSYGAATGTQAQGGPNSLVRPAAAAPPERIRADRVDETLDPGARPVVPPRDDPRSVEETKDLPAPADR